MGDQEKAPEQKTPETQKADVPKAEAPKSGGAKEISFTLAQNAAIWEGSRGDGTKLRLSRFTGEIFGTVQSSDEYLYTTVRNAIANGELIDTKKPMEDKVAEKEEIIDITNMAEDRNTAKTRARQLLKTMTAEDLEKQIPVARDPYLIASMIELESRGVNKSKRKRDAIMALLKARLDVITKELKSKSVMVGVSEQTDEAYKVTQGADNF